jgi:hypothetical protein
MHAPARASSGKPRPQESSQRSSRLKTELDTRQSLDVRNTRSSLEKSLTALERLIRRTPPGEDQPVSRTILLPLELTGGQSQYLGLLADEEVAFNQAKEAVVADLRFEHLRDADDAVCYFVGECWADTRIDHVQAFLDRHGRDVLDLVCYIPVEYLSVTIDTEVFGIHLLPLDDPRLPKGSPWFNLVEPAGCVAAVAVSGTNYELMSERAVAAAQHALRVLRVALREHRGVNDRQLRFKLGIAYAFDQGVSGWRQREEIAYELELADDLVNLARGQSVSTMPVEPSTDVDKKADLALRWMERSRLSGDPIAALLYLFFALEALLGEKSEGPKAHGLAFRQAMLSHVVTSGFTHPNETWFLYDQVRSAAVHGEDVEVGWSTVQGFASLVRRTLNQYITLARERGFAKRSRLLKVLDQHPDRLQLIAWLRRNGGPPWTDFLDSLAKSNTG